jgi:ornithine cyclodeaminase/alanine dehydrogenase-like protein (mu-crystallin family)
VTFGRRGRADGDGNLAAGRLQRMAMQTLVLTRSDVARHLEALTLMQGLREGFCQHPAEGIDAPQRAFATLPHGATTVRFPGQQPQTPAYIVEVDTHFPGQQPAPRGLLQLHDLDSGALLAVMDADHLITIRTALVGAIAADLLARPDAARVAVVGAGPLGRVQLKMLRLVRSLRHVRVFDPLVQRAHVFAHDIFETLSLPTRTETSVEAAVWDADLVITSVGGQSPLLHPGMLPSGAHVSAVGGNDAGVRELSIPLIRQSRFFCDDRQVLCRLGGPVEVSVVVGDLGEVLRGEVPGRTSPDEVTLFSSVGLPFQDLTLAWQVYQGALEDQEVRRVDFGA